MRCRRSRSEARASAERRDDRASRLRSFWLIAKWSLLVAGATSSCGDDPRAASPACCPQRSRDGLGRALLVRFEELEQLEWSFTTSATRLETATFPDPRDHNGEPRIAVTGASLYKRRGGGAHVLASSPDVEKAKRYAESHRPNLREPRCFDSAGYARIASPSTAMTGPASAITSIPQGFARTS